MVPFSYATDLTGDSRLAEDLDYDSIDLVELVMDLEAAFDIEIADADAERFTTVNDVAAYIQKRMEEAVSPGRKRRA